MTAESRASPRRQNEQGFTLIEVLLALAIAGTVMVALATGLHAIARSWTTNSAAIQRQDMILRGLEIFARDVRGLQRISWLVKGKRRVAFDGAHNRVQLVALQPPFPSKPGLYFIRYRIARDAGGATLLRERAVYTSQIRSFAALKFTDAVPLFQGPYSYAFEYGRLRNGRHVWSERWADERNTPNLVRIRITDRHSGLDLMPALTVHPRIDAELECIRPRSKLCTLKRGGAKPNQPTQPLTRQALSTKSLSTGVGQ